MSTDVTSVTAVEWAWRSDAKWESFSDAVNLKLENAYSAGKDKVKVDKERFVDLSLKVSNLFDLASQRPSFLSSRKTLPKWTVRTPSLLVSRGVMTMSQSEEP